MSEITADAMKQYMIGPITTGADLVRIRRMIGMDQITFAKLIGKSNSAIIKAEDSNVLPKDIQWLAKAVMIEHMSNVAVKHLRDMQLNSNDLAVLARVFSSRLVDEVQEELKDE
ncbi:MULTISPECIES: hypothetical protein [Aeromonas]|jgi:DNA-binding XRE family transcriptional regulator|uniref:Uncharacterized protein n=1 Tax=Aeromonas media TaxID=651 RepID=A0AAE6SMU7_AERME|nr:MULTISPECIES: hypothetical protein [Aeromonas]MBA8782533.1 hypothetical protein [Aeromonas caviae]MBA8786588.1 hypothetical protein [Aeromonas sp. TW 6]QHQ53654.1 hypothetical protein GWI30_22710 [Aeromonas media]QQQ16087.1 hypothetical protein JJL53_23765 [Aeromonas media]RDD50648.1 hypothetical protein ASJ36_07500 [Aeromonas sp. ARM81]